MTARGLISVILKNINKPFVNSATSYDFFRLGESSVSPVDSSRCQGHGFSLSSLASFKIPDPPKKPMTSFVCYMMERREDLLKVQPGLKLKDILKKVAIDWGALSVVEKKPYLERFEIKNEEFKAMKAKWWNNLTDKQKEEYTNFKEEVKKNKEHKALKKTLHLLGKPKQPAGAFAHYISQFDKKSAMSGQELFALASKNWKSMSDIDKQPFVNMVNVRTAQYKTELLLWQKKMLDEGKIELVQHKAKVDKHTEAKAVQSNLKHLGSSGKTKKK